MAFTGQEPPSMAGRGKWVCQDDTTLLCPTPHFNKGKKMFCSPSTPLSTLWIAVLTILAYSQSKLRNNQRQRILMKRIIIVYWLFIISPQPYITHLCLFSWSNPTSVMIWNLRTSQAILIWFLIWWKRDRWWCRSSIKHKSKDVSPGSRYLAV